MTNTTIATFGTCTVYQSGMFGYTRIECREATLMHGPYAQHADVPKLRFVRKGCRRPEGIVLDSSRVVILEGHGHPELTIRHQVAAAGYQETRHYSYSPEWDREFNAALSVYVGETKARLLVDTKRMP